MWYLYRQYTIKTHYTLYQLRHHGAYEMLPRWCDSPVETAADFFYKVIMYIHLSLTSVCLFVCLFVCVSV